jgi:L-ribulose-5-phosphate 3-epimerase
MIKGISYWSVVGGLENTCPVDAAMGQVKAAGFDAIELCVAPQGVLTPQTDQATCEGYRKMADDRGVTLETMASGMSWAFSPSDLDASVRQKSIDLHVGAIQRAAWLGCDAMLFVPGAVKIPWEPGFGPVPYDQAVEWARDAVTRVGEEADKVGVDLCVENVWNGMFYSPLEFAQFIDSFNSDCVGVYFDTGNVQGYHQHPPHWINILGKRIKRVHIKDFKNEVGTLDGFCDLLDGDQPWPETIAALKSIGYDKTIIAEMIPPDEGILDRTSAAMDKILAM